MAAELVDSVGMRGNLESVLQGIGLPQTISCSTGCTFSNCPVMTGGFIAGYVVGVAASSSSDFEEDLDEEEA